jgi:uncharacterized Zn finger protein
MSRYYGDWAPYVPVAERRKRAERAIAKLAKKGQVTAPVNITGKRIASTFWGKAWCDNLESYRDFETRLPRGRTYVRNGSVLDLQIAPREIKAMVSGSSLYHVSVSIGALPKAQWEATCRDCAGGIDSLVELLQGRFSKGVMERICQQGKGLFPKPSEIKFSCSCPDYASMCKHIAAVLYGVGARLDERPELLFQLRAVDQNELVASLDNALPLSKTGPNAAKVLADDDISALFGLDMAPDEASAVPSPKAPRRNKKIAAASAAAKAKTNAKRASVRAIVPAKTASRKSAAVPSKVPRTAKHKADTVLPTVRKTPAARVTIPAHNTRDEAAAPKVKVATKSKQATTPVLPTRRKAASIRGSISGKALPDETKSQNHGS